MESAIRLNVGAGDVKIPGFIPLDIKDGIDAAKLPYANESVDEVYASHVLEHVSHQHTMDVLREWHRVLKPNGTIRIAVPDASKLLPMLMDPGTVERAEHAFFGSHIDGDDIHRALFTPEKLVAQLYRLGFHKAGRFQPFAQDCSCYDISLNIEAFKRAFTINRTPRFIWVLSQGRMTFTEHEKCLMRAAQKFGGESVHYYSAFWEKGMTIGAEKALESGADYLIFSDYDSVFEAEDVAKLVEVLQHNPYAGAAVAWQMSRHKDEPLVFDDSVQYSGTTTRVKFSHFGLAVIRAQVFREIPKPWFLSVPDPNGEWGKSNAESDADISFWRVLDEHGIQVIQRNDVVIGHMELAVRWPHPEGVQQQPVRHYNAHGKPKDIAVDPEVYRKLRDAAAKRAAEAKKPAGG